MANLEATFIAPEAHPTTAGALRALVREVFADAGGAVEGRLRGLGVSPADPEAGFAVTVDAGSAVVAADDNLGSYFVTMYGAETVPWPPAGGQGRVDSLVLVVADSDYGAVPGSVGASWRVVEGVAAPSPVARSDDDLAAALGTAGGHLRMVDITVPPAPQETITGNLITSRAAAVRQALQTVVVEDLGLENIPVNPGGDMVNISPASITVPPSGKVKVTLRGTLTASVDAIHRFGFRAEGAAVLAFTSGWSVTFTKTGTYSFCDVNLFQNMTPGATLTVRAAGLTTGASGQATTSAIRWILEQMP